MKISKSEILSSLVFGVAILITMLTPACMQLATYTSYRAITGRIFNELLIETDDGELWYYESEYPRDTSVIVTFKDKGTVDVTDDEIISVVTKD